MLRKAFGLAVVEEGDGAAAFSVAEKNSSVGSEEEPLPEEEVPLALQMETFPVLAVVFLVVSFSLALVVKVISMLSAPKVKPLPVPSAPTVKSSLILFAVAVQVFAVTCAVASLSASEVTVLSRPKTLAFPARVAPA